MSDFIKLLEGVNVEWVNLGNITQIKTGRNINKQYIFKNSGIYPVINSGKEPLGYVNEWNTENDPIGITSRGAGVGSITWQDGKYFRGNLNYSVTINNIKLLSVRYLYNVLIKLQPEIKSLCTFDGIPALNLGNLVNLKIPIPCPDNPEKSLKIQEEIVRILDRLSDETNKLTAALQKELEIHQKQYDYYREELFKFEGKEVEWKCLGVAAENLDAMRQPVKSGSRDLGEIPYYGASGIVDYVKDYIFEGDFLLISEDGANLLSRSTPIAFSISGKSWVNNHAHILKFETHAQRRLIEYYLNSIDLEPYITGAAQPKLNQKNLNKIKVPVLKSPVLENTVKILDDLDAKTKAITKAIQKEITLRNKQYVYYRDHLLTFSKSKEI